MIALSYRMLGDGWALCTVAIDGRQWESDVSYMGNTIGELLEAIALVVEGVSESRVAFFAEPGEDRWVFRRLGRGVDALVNLTVFFHHEWLSGRPDDHGRTAFAAEVPIIELALAARAMAREVMAEYDRDATQRLWRKCSYPLNGFERLNRFLAV